MGLSPASSQAQGLDYCNRCGECCVRSPCLLLPDDVPRIAAHLGISEQELVSEKLVAFQDDGQLWVKPKRAHKDGPCLFLGDGCTIHEVKPAGGKDFECWEPGLGYRRRLSWTHDELRAIEPWLTPNVEVRDGRSTIHARRAVGSRDLRAAVARATANGVTWPS